MRAIWKGHIRFSLVTIPVRIYNAIDASHTVRFNQLSKEDKNPVGYEKVDKVTGKSLKKDDIVKGYQYEPGQFVIMDDDDFDKVRLKSTKIIEIEGFVDVEEVHPTLYDSAYFAGPDGDVAAKTYSLLCTALKNSGKLGVGRVVIRDRENVVLLSPHEKGILLYKLRSTAELRDINNVPEIDEEVEADEEQLKMANLLIDSLSKSFEDIDMSDRYRDALMEIIDAKIEGKEIISIEEEEQPTIDIMTALKDSIAQAKAAKKPMQKAKKESKRKVKSKAS